MKISQLSDTLYWYIHQAFILRLTDLWVFNFIDVIDTMVESVSEVHACISDQPFSHTDHPSSSQHDDPKPHEHRHSHHPTNSTTTTTTTHATHRSALRRPSTTPIRPGRRRRRRPRRRRRRSLPLSSLIRVLPRDRGRVECVDACAVAAVRGIVLAAEGGGGEGDVCALCHRC